MIDEYINTLGNKYSFNRQEFGDVVREYNNYQIGDEAIKKRLNKLLKNETIVRIGRNEYSIPAIKLHQYNYQYTQLSIDIAKLVQDTYPYLDFLILELAQLNEFTNHQIAHNIIFLSVESEIMEFVFETLRQHYPGKVLINPNNEMFSRYWDDNIIVIIKIVTEAPKGKIQKWHTRIENILVDLLSAPLLQSSVSDSEYPVIFDNVINGYIFDKSCLFRYAGRRGVINKLKLYIE